MPIGAYNPWISNHCTPEQAVAMADAAGARLFVPVHHQSFSLSREPVREPIERAERMLHAEQGRLGLREIGETVVVTSDPHASDPVGASLELQRRSAQRPPWRRRALPYETETALAERRA